MYACCREGKTQDFTLHFSRNGPVPLTCSSCSSRSRLSRSGSSLKATGSYGCLFRNERHTTKKEQGSVPGHRPIVRRDAMLHSFLQQAFHSPETVQTIYVHIYLCGVKVCVIGFRVRVKPHFNSRERARGECAPPWCDHVRQCEQLW